MGDEETPDNGGNARENNARDDRSSPPPSVADALRALRDATQVLTTLDPTLLEGSVAAAVAAELASTTSRLSVVRARLLPVIDADGLWATGGARSFPVWVAAEHRVSVAAARADVRLGRTLRDHLPAASAAALAGEITAEQARVLATHTTTSPQRLEVLGDPGHECNETFLVDQARQLHVDALRSLARHWAAAADPDADDRGYVESTDREHLELSRLAEGYHVAGWLTVEHGQLVRQALDAVTPVPAADDERTGTQRRAQALADLARVGLDHGLVGTGRAVRPRLSVLVSHADLTALARAAFPGEDTPPTLAAAALTGQAAAGGPQFEDGTPISRALLDRLACDSELNRIIFGPRSEVLDVGRAERTFVRARRTAIVARDKHCRYPTCTASPALCEGHHIEHWARDHGPTAADKGVLLCWHHHALVHRRHIEVHRRGSSWVFLDAHGLPIDPDRDASTVL